MKVKMKGIAIAVIAVIVIIAVFAFYMKGKNKNGISSPPRSPLYQEGMLPTYGSEQINAPSGAFAATKPKCGSCAEKARRAMGQ